MATDSAVLQSFVPGQLVRWLTEQVSAPVEPTSKEHEMVTWFADLSDFSHLTYEITERERAGPELVGELLNQTFGTIIETVTRYGGDVLEFAGDAVLATWTIGDDFDRVQALVLASRCGLEVLELKLPEVYAERAPLELRIGIGVGTGVLMQLGGVNGQWHFMIGGKPFEQIGMASGVARPGEVVLSPQATDSIGAAARGRLDEKGFLRLTDVDSPASPGPSSPAMTPELAAQLRRFLSQPVLSRIDAGQSEWLAEFRQVTSVFVNLPKLDSSVPAARDALQDVIAKAQATLAKYEGTLSRILDDDKGTTLVASFGLPPFAHEEDPYLAVQAAEEIQKALTQMKLDYGIGVATGRAFCGASGSPVRRNYTTIGREVNLAARLMQAARFEILCDEATARATRRIQFHALDVRQLRGWDRPVQVFKPLWEKAGGAAEEHGSTTLVGRETEQNQLTAWLGALVRAGSSAVVMVEGEAGIGKSALADDLIRTARSFDVQVLTGAALPVAQAPYQAWRDVIGDVLGVTNIRSLERRQEMVRERLARWPQFMEWEALLNSVLDLQFPETASTRGMSGRNRRDSTVELLVALLSEAATRSPLLIVLDDLHWFDSASWAVALAAVRKVSPLLLVLLTRPMLEPPEEMDELADLGSSAHLVLKPISQQSALELAKERLGAREIGPDVADVIVGTAEGIPFFIEELALSLRETNAVIEDEGTVRLARPVHELGVPHALSSVVLSRIDRLAPQLQLTLKVASVIGRSFDTRALEAVHPSHPGVAELAGQLSELKDLDLIIESSPGSYDFKHGLTRDTAYDLLLFDQRRRIHRSVAGFLESLSSEPQEPLYALLAYHWDRGEDRQKALGYFEKTGASALRKGANREAVEAHSRSLDLVHRSPDDFPEVSRLRQSQWHVEIGQAYEALGNFDEAEKSLYRALDLVGVHVPAEPLRRIGRLTWETIKQAVHIALPWTIRIPGDEDEQARLGQGARIAALIGEIYYFTGDLAGFPVLNLVAINLGEKSGEPMVAGLAYSNLGYLVGTLRMRRLADRYFRRARSAQDLETDREFGHTAYVLELQEMGPGHLIAVALAESVLALTFDEWSRAREIVTEGLERCDRLGDKYSAGIALAVRGFVSYSSGDLEDALHDYNQLLASARQRANREHEGWATSFVIPVLLARNRLDDARSMSSSAMAILNDVDPLTVPIIHGTRSQVQLRAGHTEDARESAELALTSIDRTPIFIYLAGFAGLLDTLLELWAAESDPASANARELAKLTRQGLKKLKGFARILPFARPKHLLFKGRMEHLEGRVNRARRSLRKGLDLAKKSGFTWDEGLIHLELARTLRPDALERRAHLEQARRLFEKVGSLHDLERVGALDV
jgi:class 3 adenylate cyclase/tetratricopeptide (TPR) repeat protein